MVAHSSQMVLDVSISSDSISKFANSLKDTVFLNLCMRLSFYYCVANYNSLSSHLLSRLSTATANGNGQTNNDNLFTKTSRHLFPTPAYGNITYYQNHSHLFSSIFPPRLTKLS